MLCPERKKEAPAVITVYLALVLLIVTGLIFTVTESARLSAAKARAGSVTYMAADSAFAAYAEPIFEDYGVMFLWLTQDAAKESFTEYAEENLSSSDLTSLVFTDLYGISLSNAEVTSAICPSDNEGEPFAEQVLEYMQYFLAENALESVLDSLSVFENTEAVSDFMEKISEKQEVFTRVEEAVSEISALTDEAASAENPSDYLSALSEAAEEYLQSGSADAASAYSSALASLKSSSAALSGLLENITESTADYYEAAADAAEASDELETELEENCADLTGEIYTVLSEQIEELRQKSADTDYDYYNVSANAALAEEYAENTELLLSFANRLGEELTEENAGEICLLISAFAETFEGTDLSALGINLESTEVQKEDSSFLSSVSALFTDGFLSLVADDISENEIETESLPSVTAAGDGNDDDTGIGTISAAYDKAVFCEYILQHFGRYTEQTGESALAYEAEYVIAGKSSDKENLSAVCTDIALIRSSLNFVSLLKDSEKKNEAYALAVALVGFTGLPVLITITQLLIMSAWAAAEGICDVKTLLSGGKVETIKSSESWILSLSSLKSFSSDTVTYSSSDSGLDYSSYLRILLLAKNDGVLQLHTLDMIQADMCENENSDFLINDCLTSLSLEAVYEVPYLFLGFSFSKSISGAQGSSYEISIPLTYEY